jgi:hypothetical protein
MEPEERWRLRIAERMELGREYYFDEIEGIAGACRPKQADARLCADLHTMLLNDMDIFSINRFRGSIIGVKVNEESSVPVIGRRVALEKLWKSEAECTRLKEQNDALRARVEDEMPALRAALVRVERLGLVGALVVLIRRSPAGMAQWVGEFVGL